VLLAAVQHQHDRTGFRRLVVDVETRFTHAQRVSRPPNVADEGLPLAAAECVLAGEHTF
jgi:hypothetical protein